VNGSQYAELTRLLNLTSRHLLRQPDTDTDQQPQINSIYLQLCNDKN